jgi:hypothetical protein
MSKYILPLVSNISKSWSKKVGVFGPKFEPNTSTFFYIFETGVVSFMSKVCFTATNRQSS